MATHEITEEEYQLFTRWKQQQDWAQAHGLPTEPPPELIAKQTAHSEWGCLSKGWVRFPVALLHVKELNPTDTILLAVLIDRIGDNNNKTGKLSRPRLAEITGLSIATIKRSLQKLRELHLIETGTHSNGNCCGTHLTVTLTGAAEILPPKKRKEETP